MVQSTAEVRVEGFSISFPTATIQADFRIRWHERVVLSGPSGSGKTTLFRFIAGFHVGAPSRGNLWLGDQRLTHSSPASRFFGVVPQQPLVFPHLSVLENASFALKMKGVEAEARRKLVLPWLEKCGLGRHLNSPAETLSGGEKQRLSLVRAWCWKPRVVLLDEPFSGLDSLLRKEMADWVLELHSEHPVPLLWITHDRPEVEKVGTREIVLESMNGVHRWTDLQASS